MTWQELITRFNRSFGINHEWPETYEVDAETYASCCQAVFDKANQVDVSVFLISLGKSRGLKFKNVELILKKNA